MKACRSRPLLTAQQQQLSQLQQQRQPADKLLLHRRLVQALFRLLASSRSVCLAAGHLPMCSSSQGTGASSSSSSDMSALLMLHRQCIAGSA
jgi:hypothetical protein